MNPPLQALSGHGEEASVNAVKAPPQALGRSLHGAYCIAQSTKQEHHEASSPGTWRGGFMLSWEWPSAMAARPLPCDL